MTIVLDEFDLDVRLGGPLGVDGLTAIGPQTDGDICAESHHATCGDYCPTHIAVCPSGRSGCC